MPNPNARLFDPVSRSFHADVLAQLEAYIQNGTYASAYGYLSDVLLSIDPLTGSRYIEAAPDIHKVQLFFDGAEEANAGNGVFSAWIRTYTQTQGMLRYGTTFSSTDMQRASDAVASDILLDIGGLNLLPTIDDIALDDALNIRNELFPELGDNNPAWSGVVLYSVFGEPQTWRLDAPTFSEEAFNWTCCAVSNELASGAALGDLALDPAQFFTEDAGTLFGVGGLWWTFAKQWFTRDGTGAPSDLIDTSALTPPVFDGTPLDVDDLFDPAALDTTTPRVHVGYGETLTGAVGDVAELFVGGAGAEAIQGNGGADLVITGAGDDTIDAGWGDDILYGGAGLDVLSGGDGNDALVGGDGDDRFDGGRGNNVMIGDEGADTFVIDPLTNDDGGVNVIWGGAGDDIYRFSGYNHVTLVDVSQPDLDAFLSLDFSALPFDGTIIVNPEQGDRLFLDDTLVAGADYGLIWEGGYTYTGFNYTDDSNYRTVSGGILSGDGPQSPVPIPYYVHTVLMPDLWEEMTETYQSFGFVDESGLYYSTPSDMLPASAALEAQPTMDGQSGVSLQIGDGMGRGFTIDGMINGDMGIQISGNGLPDKWSLDTVSYSVNSWSDGFFSYNPGSSIRHGSTVYGFYAFGPASLGGLVGTSHISEDSEQLAMDEAFFTNTSRPSLDFWV